MQTMTRWVWLGFLLCSVACGYPSPSTAPSAPGLAAKRHLAQACPALAAKTPTTTPTSVFVELAVLEGDSEPNVRQPVPPPARILRWQDDPRLGVTNVFHVLVKGEVPATMAWESPPCAPGPKSCAEQWQFAVTPHPSSTTPDEMRLDLRYGPASIRDLPGYGRGETTLVVRDQQSVLMGLDPERKESKRVVLVLTPYFIHRPDDLRELFRCKQEAQKRP
jgi:hypothetical protein